jgi:hypothetical protein
MKTAMYVLPVFLFIASFAMGQSVAISGKITNPHGHPLHFAFIRENTEKNGVYADTAGNFTLAVNPASKLHINCAGYNDTTLAIGTRTVFSVVLSQAFGVIAKPIAKESTAHNDINQTAFRDQLNQSPDFVPTGANIPASAITSRNPFPGAVHLTTFTNPQFDAAQGAIFPVFTVKGETKGSRYLMADWAHGVVVNSKDSLIQGEYYFFNYDKIGGGLLLSQNKKAAIEVYREMVKSFTLYDEDGKAFTFENIPAIDKNHYVEVVEEGPKYKIYKKLSTTFVKSEYETNGITSSGNQYDEYVDKATYYLVGKDGIAKQIALKKKALKELFNSDPEKLNQYMASTEGDIDDSYLKGLGDYMNR